VLAFSGRTWADVISVGKNLAEQGVISYIYNARDISKVRSAIALAYMLRRMKAIIRRAITPAICLTPVAMALCVRFKPFYKHIKTAQQRTIIQQYGYWYTGRSMDGLLHLVQRGGACAGCGTAQTPHRRTKCNIPSISGQFTNFILFDVAL